MSRGLVIADTGIPAAVLLCWARQEYRHVEAVMPTTTASTDYALRTLAQQSADACVYAPTLGSLPERLRWAAAYARREAYTLALWAGTYEHDLHALVAPDDAAMLAQPYHELDLAGVYALADDLDVLDEVREHAVICTTTAREQHVQDWGTGCGLCTDCETHRRAYTAWRLGEAMTR